MLEWFESVAGPAYAPALMWTALALIALVVVLVAVRLFRNLTFGTFVAGGRNRKARLAVIDATAVDSQRRLVLVRRDNVEHLILIGGANDVVVERDIELAEEEEAHLAAAEPRMSESRPAPERITPPAPSPAPAPSPTPAPAPQIRPRETVAAMPAERPRPAADQPAPRPAAPARPPQTDEAPGTPASERAPAAMAVSAPALQPRRLEPTPEPIETMAVSPDPEPRAAAPTPESAPAPAAAQPEESKVSDDIDLDDALLQELELTLDDERREPTMEREPELDDEMDRLLGELSGEKR